MTSDRERPDPDSLLAVAGSAQAAAGRGRLKIFLGYAPGVGKTFTMLEAARARQRAGGAVLVGVALTHGRAETAALLAGLPLLQPRMVEHRGARLEEFDLDAALKRRPGLILVDELAHDNAPGSRHPKRWQDVEELLAAGCDVATTLNIQHVESVHDVVQRLTGIDVRERVPDEVLDRADEIELVDLPPAELLDRLRAGKVYLGDAAARALSGFFSAETLAGLRELALRQVADRVRAGRVAKPADGGRLLVCIGPSPFSARLLRATRRMAERMQVGWIAVHVQTPEDVGRSDEERQRCHRHLQLAERLGGEAHQIGGDRLASTIVAFARRHGASRIVVGKPVAPRWREWLKGSLVFELVRTSGDIDVYVINGETGDDRDAAHLQRPAHHDRAGIGFAIAVVAATTGLCWLTAARLEPVNLSMLYLLAVVLVAFRGRRTPVVVAAVLSVALFDFLFVPPLFSFSVHDPQYLLTFAAMLVVGLVVSTLVARLRAQVDSALRQAATAQALHRVSQDLATTRGTAALVEIAAARCRETLGCAVAILVNDRPGAGTLAAAAAELIHAERADLPPAELAVAQWVVSHGEAAGAGTTTLPGAKGLHLPLGGSRGVVGVLCCLGVGPELAVDPDRRRLAESLAKLVGLAIECDRLADAAQEARLAVEAERLRSALLSTVSHDLRTPLAAIAGSASTMLSGEIERERQRGLLATIAEETERMSRLVGNLLEVTRLEGGAVRLTKVPVAVEDLIGAARAALGQRLADHPLAVDVPTGCPPVPVDEVLIQSLLVNLLDNAVKYTAPGSPLAISAQVAADHLTITVADRGPGLADDEVERVFDKFYRGATGRGQRGVGLGLAICRAVVAAHGGRISARNRADGGAEFAFTLPLGTITGHG